jgi:hypothetical protein
MSNKSFKNMFGLLGGTSSASGSETICENGHPMDPSWTHCPRCDAESRANERSTDMSSAYTFDENDSRSPAMSSRQHTVVPGSTPSDSSATRRDADYDSGYESGYESGGPNVSAGPRHSSRRKITGVLVCFTWERQGELFVIYEGRNVIGKGTVESEGGRPCDVQLSVDPTMSNEHALILCRAGRYELFDNRSTNGTYADDQFVESAGVMLRDGARIKTGETIWMFRKIESDDAGAQPGRAHRDEPRREERHDERRDEPARGEPHRPPRDDSRIA